MAYRGTYEKDPYDPEYPSEDAIIGACCEAEYQLAMIDLHRGFFQVFGK